MKKIIVAASLAAIGFAVSAFVNPKTSSDVNFEGVVTYSINIDNPQLAAMMQGSAGTFYMKGDKTKFYIDMIVQKITIFSDRKTPDAPIMLMEMGDNKFQIKDDTTKKDDTKDPVIKYTDETKVIAGYTCHKAEVTMTDRSGQTSIVNVYYTEELPYYNGKKSPFKGLKGFPMEYPVKQPIGTLTFSATKVEKQPVSDNIFAVPSGYKLMTMQQIMQEAQNNSDMAK